MVRIWLFVRLKEDSIFMGSILPRFDSWETRRPAATPQADADAKSFPGGKKEGNP